MMRMMKVIFNLILALNFVFFVDLAADHSMLTANNALGEISSSRHQGGQQQNEMGQSTELKQLLQREEQINHALQSMRGGLKNKSHRSFSASLESNPFLNNATPKTPQESHIVAEDPTQLTPQNTDVMIKGDAVNPSTASFNAQAEKQGATNTYFQDVKNDLSNEQCKILCGQYTNYNYAIILSSLILAQNKVSDYYFKVAQWIANNSITSPKECTAERLAVYLVGNNDRYANSLLVQGMPTPKIHFDFCVKQCEQGGKGVLYNPQNPAIKTFEEILRITKNMQTDQAFAMAAASGSGGF